MIVGTPKDSLFVRLGPDVRNDVRDAEQQLVLDRIHPRVVVQTQRALWPEQIQVAQLRRQDGQPVVLEVQLAEQCQVAHFLGQRDEVVVAEDEDLEIPQLPKRNGEK